MAIWAACSTACSTLQIVGLQLGRAWYCMLCVISSVQCWIEPLTRIDSPWSSHGHHLSTQLTGPLIGQVKKSLIGQKHHLIQCLECICGKDLFLVWSDYSSRSKNAKLFLPHSNIQLYIFPWQAGLNIIMPWDCIKLQASLSSNHLWSLNSNLYNKLNAIDQIKRKVQLQDKNILGLKRLNMLVLLLFAFYAYPEWLNKIHVYFLRIFSDEGISRPVFSNVPMIQHQHNPQSS